MKISASFLGIKENIKEKVSLLTACDIDYLHLDIMDGKFVSNKSLEFSQLRDLLNYNKPLDVHLMVEDIEKYIEQYKELHPDIITVHYEVSYDLLNIINKIHSYGIKAGVAIKPETNVERLIPFLENIDLILVMSVEPGQGGQSFMMSSIWKIAKLVELKENNNYTYQIAVDGGINNETISHIDKADIAVIGNFITNGDYKQQIEKIRFALDE